MRNARTGKKSKAKNRRRKRKEVCEQKQRKYTKNCDYQFNTKKVPLLERRENPKRDVLFSNRVQESTNPAPS